MPTTRVHARSIARLSLVAAIALLVAACGTNPPTPRPSGSDAAHAGASAAVAGASSPADAPVAPCKAADLKAQITSWSGAAGSRYATVDVTNKSKVTCTLRGTPGVRLLDGKGKIVLDSAKVKSVGGPKIKSGDTAVVVDPGDDVAADVQWTNWCSKQPTRPLTVALVLTNSGGLLKAAKAKESGLDDAPSCSAKSQPATVKITHSWSGPGL
jgi:hypothetical protein